MTFSGSSTPLTTGPFDVTINDVQLGHTEENIQLLQWGESETNHNSHEAGDVPVKVTRGPRTIRLEIRSLQIQKNLLDEVFAEAASITTDGLVTVGAASGAQDSLTNLTPVTITLHPSDVTGTAHDIVLSNMVNVGAPFDQPLGRPDKLMLNLFFIRTWSDTSVAYTVGGFATPA